MDALQCYAFLRGRQLPHDSEQDVEDAARCVDKTTPGAAAVSQKGKWDYLIGVGLACFIGLLNGSLSGDRLLSLHSYVIKLEYSLSECLASCRFTLV
jgi:hypothetical protein